MEPSLKSISSQSEGFSCTIISIHVLQIFGEWAKRKFLLHRIGGKIQILSKILPPPCIQLNSFWIKRVLPADQGGNSGQGWLLGSIKVWSTSWENDKWVGPFMLHRVLWLSTEPEITPTDGAVSDHPIEPSTLGQYIDSGHTQRVIL